MALKCPYCGASALGNGVTCGASECQQANYYAGQARLRPRSDSWAALAEELTRHARRARKARERDRV